MIAFPNGPVDFHQDFRRKPFAAKSFRVIGPEASMQIKTEPEGLSITLPSGVVSKEGLEGLSA